MKNTLFKKILNITTIFVLFISMTIPSAVGANASESTMKSKLDQGVLQSFNDSKMVTYMVKLKEKANTTKAITEVENKLTTQKLSAHKIQELKNEAVVQLLQETARVTQQNLTDYLLEEQDKGNVENINNYFIVNGLSVTSTKEVAEKIATFSEVEKILPNETRQLLIKDVNPVIKVNEMENTTPWSIHRTGAPKLWEKGIDGSGVVIANIDSGVQWDHPALKEQYRGYNAETGDVDHSFSWFDPINESSEPFDDVGHGTHVTGTMVGAEPNGSNQVGVAPGAKWIAVKAFSDSGETTDADLLNAAQWILLPTDAEGNERPDLRPHIVNNSWGGGAGLDEWYRDVVNEWRNVGILPVFAAGNISMFNPGGEGSIENPANYPESFAVGATDVHNQIGVFSLRGPSPYGEIKPDVAAPGVGIYSAIPGSDYGDKNGTSMATPAVSGMAALLLSYQPDLNIDQLEDIVKSTAIPLTDDDYQEVPNNAYGHGLADALNAISSLDEGLGSVEGKIVSKDGKEIIYPGDIFVKETERYIRTKSDNSFSTIHPVGQHTLVVDMYGYEQQEYVVDIKKDETVEIELVLTEIAKGKLTGQLTDKKTSELITNATLTLKEDPHLDPVRSDSNGDYSIEGYIGDYTLLVTAPGYKDQEVAVNLTATDQELDLVLVPYYTYPGDEIAYDNGAIVNGSMYFAGGAGWAVKMTLPEGQETAVVKEGLFAFIDKGFGDPADRGDEFAVEVWDASGEDGMPGKRLTPLLDAKVQWDSDWTSVDLSEENVKVGKEFYVVYFQTMEYPNAPGLATDDGNPYNHGRSFQYMDGGFYPAFVEDGNYMIRAKVDYEIDEPQILTPEDGTVSSKGTVIVEGVSSPTTTVKLTNNGSDVERQVVGENGQFSFEVNLVEGNNELQVFTMVDEIEAKESNTVTVMWEKTESKIDRLAGKQRYDTAIAISQSEWEDNSLQGKQVVLARGDDFSDALAGVPLAHALDAPILLWPSSESNNYQEIIDKVREEIDRLGDPEIIILGDIEAVSLDVERTFSSTERLSGKTRIDTAVAIADWLVDNGHATGEEAVVVNGYDFPDALSVASYAAQQGLPVLLTHQDKLSESTEKALQGLGSEKVAVQSTYVIGGTLAVDEHVLAALPNAERISGINRYQTNEEVIKHFDIHNDHLYIATGNDYADALSGAVLAARNNSAIVLIQEATSTVFEDTLNFIDQLNPKAVTIVGGKLAVSENIEERLQEVFNN